ncbi:(p)ppGpp synthetase, partial [Achromatium sp. WMS1]
DVIEDTDISKAVLTQKFDAEIADLVDGVSKLTQIDFKNRAEAQAANMDKMLLAMTKDIRVILIKLADRLHNMRTLDHMIPQKRKRIAKETLEIYGPIANRLGLSHICLELEELGFKYYWPWRYKCLNKAVIQICKKRTQFIQIVEQAVSTRLKQEGIVGRVIGRQKHIYSIYQKMKAKRRSFSEVVDVYALRIVVDQLDTCYRTLGIVHSLYKPVPGRFKDYIAIPKANSYQSLHTLLVGPNGIRVEMQIRTEDMHKMAESGIAAHWIYKASSTGQESKIHTHAHQDWLRNLLEIKQGSKDPIEFLENVKVDLFPDEVYVFTPKGKIVVLPQGATIVDFAYAIHSDIGNTCIGARVDHHLVPLRSRLHSGQTVEI